MTREWKPGQIATYNNEHVIFTDDYEWRWATTGLACVSQERVGDSARPVVIIDPEDREQIESLAKVLGVSGAFTGSIRGTADALQAALRSLVAPPKPDEPKGLGAVVADDEGSMWIRTSRIVTSHRNDWIKAGGTATGSDKHHWSAIAAVRVLSEGVA